MIRPATVYDVPRVQEIINSHAELGKMLFKSLAQLYEDLRDFAVYEEGGQILGCVGLTIIWADMAEVRSDCVRCPKREGCDEIAMVRVLEDVPIINLPAATPTPRGVSIPLLEYA